MVALAQPFDLDPFLDGARITRVAEALFDISVTPFTSLGQGFYFPCPTTGRK